MDLSAEAAEPAPLSSELELGEPEALPEEAIPEDALPGDEEEGLGSA